MGWNNIHFIEYYIYIEKLKSFRQTNNSYPLVGLIDDDTRLCTNISPSF